MAPPQSAQSPPCAALSVSWCMDTFVRFIGLRRAFARGARASSSATDDALDDELDIGG
jgi:hypothetical protein